MKFNVESNVYGLQIQGRGQAGLHSLSGTCINALGTADFECNYLRQVGCVLPGVCLSVCLFVCL